MIEKDSRVLNLMGMKVDIDLVKNPNLREILENLRASNNTARSKYTEHKKSGYSDEYTRYSDYSKYEEYREYTKKHNDSPSSHSEWDWNETIPHLDETYGQIETKKKKEKCYIATAALGTPYDSKLDTIRKVRNHLRDNSKLIEICSKEYRKTAPPIAEKVRENESLKRIAVGLLVKPLGNFSEAYQSKDMQEKIVKYAKSLPFFTAFVAALVASNFASRITRT